jgi:hypothetical protein
MLRTLLVASALSALAACAGTQGAQSEGAAAATRDCFRTMDVSGYGVVDEHRVRVHISPQREYYLTINANTRDLDWTHAISIRSMTSFICVGDGAGVQLMGGDPPFPYQVTRIERAPTTNAVEGS